MQPFRGNLAYYRLPLLIPALVETGTMTGRLEVRRGSVGRTFRVWRGLVVEESSTEPREHLTQLLVDTNALSVTQAASAFCEAAERRKPLGALLVEKELIDENRLRASLAQKALAAFRDCYLWESGELSWTPEPEQVEGVPLLLEIRELHRDAVCAWKEWRRLTSRVPPHAVFRVNEAGGLDERDRMLLERARAGSCAAELLGRGPERLEMARHLARLLDQGMLSVTGEASWPVARLVETARESLRKGEPRTAVELAEQALERGPVPEAQVLYREAEQMLSRRAAHELATLEGRLTAAPLESDPHPQLTTADLYLYQRLFHGGSIRDALSAAALDELQGWRSVQRLMTIGLVRLQS